MFRKISSIFFVLVFILTFIVGCSDSGNEVAETTTTAAVADVTETADEEVKREHTPDSLPADLDFGGEEIRIWVDDSNHDYKGLNDYFQGPEEQSGDIVFDTVIDRNAKVEERLNVKFSYYEVSHAYNEVTTPVRKFIMAGEDIHDFMVEQQWGLSQLVSEGSFVNVYEGAYFDFDQPWWSNNFMDAAAIGSDKRFFLAGDYFIDNFKSAYIMYFNKQIFESNFSDPNDLYNEVIDGKWTYDLFSQYSKDVYQDLNGDGVSNDGDLFGFTTSTSAIVDHFAYGTDVKFTTRDADGLPEITLNGERGYQLAEAMYRLFYENPGCKLYTDDGKLRAEQEQIFMSGSLLFLPYSLTTADYMREMEDDYGFLPFPKLDLSQQEYRLLPHDTTTLGVIPITCTKVDIVSAVIEALSAESYRTVMPAYYETALKVKYARDDISSQMIDIIHDSLWTDFTYIYSPALSDIGTIFRALMGAKSFDLASQYATKEKSVQTGLDKIVAAYMNIE
jgi:hypothetical protein